MILKGSQRGSGQDLAVHLMRTDDNEHISIHEIRGFASDNLKDAFKEAEAISRGTNCRQYLFSLSLSPPEHACVSAEAFRATIDRIEEKLGLEGQPRAIVFHEKEGRRHAHCVWSRIDAQTMTARHHSFFKQKLMSVSRELYLENGWKMPRGLESVGERNPTNFSLAEWQQAKRQGVDPRWLKQTIQECWNNSDGKRAFSSSLEERGFFLARGDKRSFVILDHHGEIHSLPRMLGLKAKEVGARLGDGSDLPSVDAARKEIGRRLTPAMRRHIDEARSQFQKRSGELARRKEEMTLAHRQARADLDERQKTEWDEETRQRTARLPKGLLGLWHRLTGKYQQVRALNEMEAQVTRERQAQERQQLIEEQHNERAPLQTEFQELRHAQAERLSDLRKDLGRFFRFSRGRDAPERGHDTGLGLSLDH